MTMKSSLFPITALTFLGYICDSEKQAFLLPCDKRVKFASLREFILKLSWRIYLEFIY